LNGVFLVLHRRDAAFLAFADADHLVFPAVLHFHRLDLPAE